MRDLTQTKKEVPAKESRDFPRTLTKRLGSAALAIAILVVFLSLILATLLRLVLVGLTLSRPRLAGLLTLTRLTAVLALPRLARLPALLALTVVALLPLFLHIVCCHKSLPPESAILSALVDLIAYG
jgi:hypothetical protein